MPEQSLDHNLEIVRNRVASASNILVISGAGISAESGIPTFRTGGGLWDKFNPLDYATREAFKRDPVKVWKWYDERRQNAAAAQPNPAHVALAKLEQAGRRVFIVTQNVDDLHERAGSRRRSCTSTARSGGCAVSGTASCRTTAKSRFPNCRRTACAARSCGRTWSGSARTCPGNRSSGSTTISSKTKIDVCLVVGTEASFGYIVQWAWQARDAGALLVDVNPNGSGMEGIVDVHLKGKAGEVLPRIVPQTDSPQRNQDTKSGHGQG